MHGKLLSLNFNFVSEFCDISWKWLVADFWARDDIFGPKTYAVYKCLRKAVDCATRWLSDVRSKHSNLNFNWIFDIELSANREFVTEFLEMCIGNHCKTTSIHWKYTRHPFARWWTRKWRGTVVGTQLPELHNCSRERVNWHWQTLNVNHNDKMN